jgi:hypothetical protein
MAVNIVFPDRQDHKLCIGQGTKVFDADTGNEIKDINKITITVEPNNIVYVNLKIPLSNTSQFFGNPRKEYDLGVPEIERK